MKKLLSDNSRKLIDLMLTQEPKIAEAVFMDVENREAYKILDINEDGTLVLGKRSVRWWNKLFNLEKTISFKDFAFSVMKALVGMASKDPNKNIILRGLSEELISKAVMREDYDWVIDRLFDTARFGVESGNLNTVATPATARGRDESRTVNVQLENKGYIPIYDSVGNVLLHLRLKVDGYSLDKFQSKINEVYDYLVIFVYDMYDKSCKEVQKENDIDRRLKVSFVTKC